jgi:hypothetical protein
VRLSELIWVGREGKYFCKWGWTRGSRKRASDLPVGQNQIDPIQQITHSAPNRLAQRVRASLEAIVERQGMDRRNPVDRVELATPQL